MEKIEELESDFGELVGCVSELKDFQMAEFMRWKLASQAELQQMNDKIRRLEKAECKGAWSMNLLKRNQALHTALFFNNYSFVITLHPEVIDGRPRTLVIESFEWEHSGVIDGRHGTLVIESFEWEHSGMDMWY
ncbi:hypothetical protein ACLOJK_034628 [Asimina triloba]